MDNKKSKKESQELSYEEKKVEKSPTEMIREEKKPRNLSYEITMVVLGTFLILVSFVSINLSPDLLLSEDENKLIQNACNAKDVYGNYKDDSVECLSNICYLKNDNQTYGVDCDKNSIVSVTSDTYEKAKEKYEEAQRLCKNVDESGLYLDQDNNYCIDGVCTSVDEENTYQYLCPNVVVVNDEEKIDEDTKNILKQLCENYKNGDVIKEDNEQYECVYDSCKVTDEKSNMTFALRCEKNIYKVFDEDQNFDDNTINENLKLACSNDDIPEERFKENIRCSSGLCSFHYKQENYYKKCNK